MGADSGRFNAPLTPGRRDGFGERSSTVLSADGSQVEVLRLRREVTETPGFEEALRARIAQLTALKDPSFTTVRELYRDGEDLTLISSRSVGQRLSELTVRDVPRSKRPAFIARMLRKALGALTALESVGHGVTHGALTTERIFVTQGGGVCITEPVFGSALQCLALWPEELFLQFGLLAPAEEGGEAEFGPRTTVMQLAVAALSVLLDRTITLDDFTNRVPALLEEFVTEAAKSKTPSLLVAPLRAWFARALQVEGSGFENAGEADSALTALVTAVGPAAAAEIEAAAFPGVPQPRLVERAAETTHIPDRTVTSSASASAPVTPAAVSAPMTTPDAVSPSRPASPPYFAWAAAALAIVALGEAAYIGFLLTRTAPSPVEPAVVIESAQPGTTVTVDGRPAGATPLKLQVTAQTRAIRVIPAEPAAPPAATPDPATTPEAARTEAALEQAAARQRSGGVTFVSPIPLNVLEGERVLGSTADGPIVASAGTHTLDLVNTALGYRVRQVVTIRPGAIGRVAITPPMGRISINAQPWAQVLIDDTAVGETPLANVPTTLGEHQVTFRHPQFGERRERVVVRADAPARVSTTFR